MTTIPTCKEFEGLVDKYFDNRYDDSLRAALLAAYNAQAAEITAKDKRIAELEAALRDKDWSLAETWALVLNHEGHIEKLDARIAALGAALEAMMRKYSNIPLVPWEETALTEEEWLEETVVDRQAITALAEAHGEAINGS